MRCQDVERLILETRELAPEQRAEVEAHLTRCARCASLRDFWQDLHVHFSAARAPRLPSELAEKVRLAGHAEIASRLGDRAGRARAEERTAVPPFIWAAFAAITLLTLAFFIPGLQDFMQNQKLTLGTALVLILILQNALTLLFAPVVMRRQRHL
jgi:hypothetical protein